MEMGALDGVRGSNTYMFDVGLGWTGTLIEATPSDYASIAQNRPNTQHFNAAVCSSAGVVHAVEGRGEVDGIWEFMDEQFRKQFHAGFNVNDLHEVPCRPLDAILAKAGIPFYDLFSLDVEGAEYSVLETVDFSKVAFGVIVVEAWTALKGQVRKDLAVRAILERNGYHDEWNEYYINAAFDLIYRGLIY